MSARKAVNGAAAVGDVEGEQQHRADVDDGHPPARERGDEVFVGEGLGGVVAGEGLGGDWLGADRQIEEVGDEEGEDEDAGHGHESGRERGEASAADAASAELATGAAGAEEERGGRVDVEDEAHRQDDPEQPEHELFGHEGLEGVAQPARVAVEVGAAGVDLEVAEEVDQ